MSLLDLLTRSTTPLELKADTLRDWYEKADREQGPERFARAEAAGRLPILAPSGEKLAGSYDDLTGNRKLDLASLAGKTVLLDFWATWCVPCRAEIPQLNALAARHGGDGFVVLAVSSDALYGGTPERGVRTFSLGQGMRYPAIYDRKKGSLTERLGITSWPSHFLLDGEGNLLAVPGSGSRTVSPFEVEAYLSARKAQGGKAAASGKPGAP